MNTVAEFSINFTQYINEKSEITNPLPEFVQDHEKLIKLYQTMSLVRAYDTKAINLQRTGKMGTYAPINGQEAISTAIGDSMRQEDVFIPYYRDYGAQIQRGVDMAEIYAFWGGDERGSQFKNNEQDMPICVPIASQCLHAAGIAFAMKHRNEKRVAVVCIGDGGTSEGDFYEAINVAGAWKLPLVFVINSNYWAISVPREKQTACQTLAQKAIAAGIDGVQADGNDIIAMKDIMEKAIDSARRGDGPTLIEALTYRLCDHTTADDATRYQPAYEVKQAKAAEPIQRFKNYLTQQNLWNDNKQQQLDKDCFEKVKLAVETYTNRKKQPITSIFDYHYAELPDSLIEQRAQAMEEMDYA